LPHPNGVIGTGENIGMATLGGNLTSIDAAVAKIHQLFMDEPASQSGHRDIMLSNVQPFSEVGIGIQMLNGAVWLTEDFISK
jgi:hypothetical protein